MSYASTIWAERMRKAMNRGEAMLFFIEFKIISIDLNDKGVLNDPSKNKKTSFWLNKS